MPVLAGLGPFGPWELALILLIVVLIFGVGRLPEVGGAVGKGIREFRKATNAEDDKTSTTMTSATSDSGAATNGVSSADAASASDRAFCTECGASNPRGAKFCAECGHSMTANVS